MRGGGEDSWVVAETPNGRQGTAPGVHVQDGERQGPRRSRERQDPGGSAHGRGVVVLVFLPNERVLLCWGLLGLAGFCSGLCLAWPERVFQQCSWRRTLIVEHPYYTVAPLVIPETARRNQTQTTTMVDPTAGISGCRGLVAPATVSARILGFATFSLTMRVGVVRKTNVFPELLPFLLCLC